MSSEGRREPMGSCHPSTSSDTATLYNSGTDSTFTAATVPIESQARERVSSYRGKIHYQLLTTSYYWPAMSSSRRGVALGDQAVKKNNGVNYSYDCAYLVHMYGLLDEHDTTYQFAPTVATRSSIVYYSTYIHGRF